MEAFRAKVGPVSSDSDQKKMVEQLVTLETKSPECPCLRPFVDPGRSNELLVALLIKSEGHQGW